MEVVTSTLESSFIKHLPNSTDTNHEDFYHMAQYITGLIVYPITCVFGITGNILTLVVLSHKDLATSTNVYLSALAVGDLIKLINDTLYFIVLLIKTWNPDKGDESLSRLYPYAHYLFNLSLCITGWLTVSVAFERYISICHPTRAKEMCTVFRARIVSTFVFIFMIIFSLPSALRYKTVIRLRPNTNDSYHDVELTDLGRNDAFMTPYTWVQNCLRTLLPLLILVFLNARIVHELRKSRVPGKKLSSRNRITLMLIVVVIVFIICITPDAIMSTVFGFGYYDETNLVRGIREITDTLLAINSACNFVLYCTMSKVFRDTFVKMFLRDCTWCPMWCSNKWKLESQTNQINNTVK
ncbi:FMRFamide receptor-like [Octopus sinensis]|uniref:FMRFamide receptor-like n=1 Tax=Octopus sinensis TaxID=2607531 RepID=A0A6P7SIL5_9MOLL|nr:FMRFamide receptor-like [Octopus sinensis]XP_036359751.1 FMRFamide receptor-like [Octopus sinensis]